MDAIEAILTRRSTRNYKPDAVEEDKLNSILEAAQQAPSGSNSQTDHFLVIRSKDVLQKLAAMAEAAFAGMEDDGNMSAGMRHAVTQAKKGGYVFCYNAPVMIVVAHRRDSDNTIADCSCAIENMMIAANALDLGSCLINQLRLLNEDPGLVEYLCTLGMKEDERVYGAVVIGYPAGGLPDRSLRPQKGNEITFID